MAAQAAFVPSAGPVHVGRAKKRAPNQRLETSLDPHPLTVLYSLGARSSVALRNDGKRWKWVWPMEVSGHRLGLSGSPVLVRPATRELPFRNDPEIPLPVLVASAADYIASIDESIPMHGLAEILSEELARERASSSALAGPAHQGDVVAVVTASVSPLSSAYVCFPAGQVGEVLSVRPLDAGHAPNGAPDMCAVETFPTPILQVAPSSFVSESLRSDPRAWLLVRVANSTHLLDIAPSPAAQSGRAPAATISRTSELPVAATEGRKHVDVAFDPTDAGRMAVVDEGGGVWLWLVGSDKRPKRLHKSFELVKLREPDTARSDGFYRIAFGIRPGTILVLSRLSLVLIDLETPSADERIVTLLSVVGSESHPFTSLDKTAAHRRASSICISSTREVIWLNDSGSVDLRWEHNYGSGAGSDLVLTVLGTSGQDSNIAPSSETVLLSSRSGGLVQAIQTSAYPPPKFTAQPYLIAGITLPHQPLQALAVAPCHDSPEALIALAQDMSVRLLPLAMAEKSKPEGNLSRPLPYEQVLNEQPAKRPSFPEDPRAEMVHQVLDARWAWSCKFFRLVTKGLTVQPLMQSRVSFWTLTRFDRTLRMPTTLDPRFGLRAWIVGLGAVLTGSAELARETAYDFASKPRSVLLSQLEIPSLGEGSQSPDAAFFARHPRFISAGTALPDMSTITANRPVPGNADEGESRCSRSAAQLARDLSLSGAILCSKRLSSWEENDALADELFAAATGRLSLNDRQPERATTRPFPVVPPGSSQPPGSSAGALNLLLGEWVVRQDPMEYEWRSPSEQSVPPKHPGRSAARQIRPLPSPRAARIMSPAKRPSAVEALPKFAVPVVAASSAPAFRRASSPVPALSSPQSSFGPPILSQPTFPQTQVERGAFGTRPEALKKKKAGKKRMGGF